jgi:hypothetical protein
MGMDVVAQIRRATRKQIAAKEKIRIVLGGLRGIRTKKCEKLRRPPLSPVNRWLNQSAARQRLNLSLFQDKHYLSTSDVI